MVSYRDELERGDIILARGRSPQEEEEVYITERDIDAAIETCKDILEGAEGEEKQRIAYLLEGGREAILEDLIAQQRGWYSRIFTKIYE